MIPVTAIILAAGRSRRMGTHKLLLPWQGRTLLEAALAPYEALPFQAVIVVTGHNAAGIEAVVEGRRVQTVHNPDYAEGMAASLRQGVRCAPDDTRGYLVALGDMPLVRPATVQRVIDTFLEAPAPAIVQPCCGERRGHPVVFDRAFRDELLALEGDAGARPILQRHPQALRVVQVQDTGILRDIDTRAAYERIQDSSPPSA